MTTTLPVHLQHLSSKAQGPNVPVLKDVIFKELSGRTILVDSKDEVNQLVSSIDNIKNLSQAPHAIIIRWPFIQATNFRLLKNIRQNAHLVNTAIIAHDDKEINIVSQRKAMGLGLDDFFKTTGEWDSINNRIDFIRKYKAELAGNFNTRDYETVFKIPLSKRIFDICVSSFVLLLISPLLLLIALLIRLESKGPVFYFSKRVGMGCQVFDFIKFRSMSNDADKKVSELSHLNQYSNGAEQDITFFKINNDPRVTKIGRLLRKTSLDEMPQLINVLKGDMSLVGNRPLPLYEAEKLTKDQCAKRFLAPAGMTGLWQVSRRGKSDMSVDERIDLDVEYANKYSLWFDLKIIARTIPAMIQDENV